MDKLRLLVDATVLENSFARKAARTGVYFASYNIIRSLLGRRDIDTVLYSHDKRLLDRYISIYLPEFKKTPIITDLAELPVEPDIFFSPWYPLNGWINERFPRISCYSVIYDIISITHPEFFQGMKFPAMWGMLNNSEVNDHYFAISQCTKNDMVRMGRNLDPDRITVIPLAANEHFFHNADTNAFARVKEKYRIPENKKYILSLCSLEPRKNLINAVTAFIEFVEKNHIDGLVYVLAGNAWPNFQEELGRYVTGLGRHTGKVVVTGYVDDKDVSVLYSNALWFVYTSRYEGFGLPPLEAMQCGCPVVTSDNSSLPEVVGDAGITVDSLDIGQHVAAYEAYYRRPELREENIRKGLERAKSFSWDRCADIICSKMLANAEKKRSRPKISVVVPANYSAHSGDAEKIQRSLDSLRFQTYPEKGTLVVDCGANPDVSGRLLTIAAASGATIKTFPSSTDVYQAFNAVLPELDGEYATFLEPGAYYPDDRHLDICMAKSAEHDAELSYTDSVMANSRTGDIVTADIGKIALGEHFRQSAAFVRVSTLRRAGGFSVDYGASAYDELVMRLAKNKHRVLRIRHASIALEDGSRAKAPVEAYAKAFFDVFGEESTLSQPEFRELYSGDYLKNRSDARVMELAAKLPHDFGGWAVYKNMVDDRHLVEILDQKMRETMTNSRHFLLGSIPLSCTWLGDSLRSATIYRWRGISLIKVIRRGIQSFYSLFGILPLFTRKSK